MVSYNSQDYIENCLLSVIGQKYGDWFLVVGDNNSGDRTVEIINKVKNYSPQLTPANFKLVKFSRNLGFSGAINRIFFKLLKRDAHKFDYLLFVNPYMRLGRDAVHNLVAPFKNDQKIGVCGALILDYKSNQIQHLGGLILPNFVTTHIGSGKDYHQLKDEFKDKTGNMMDCIRDVSYTTGALLATRARLFSSLGGLDTGYRPAYFEELDYCLKVSRSQGRVVVNPLARARHAEAVSTRKYSRRFYRLYHKNRIRCALLHAQLCCKAFIKEEAKWAKNNATRDQYGPLAFAYAANILFLPLTMAIRAKNHFILNKIRLK